MHLINLVVVMPL